VLIHTCFPLTRVNAVGKKLTASIQSSAMDTNFFLMNNDNLVPREEVRIERVEAQVYDDQRRVKVAIQVTPFRERPNLEIVIRQAAGQPVATSSVIATMHFKMEFNLHLRGIENPAGDYTVQVVLYYDELTSPQDAQEIPLHI